MMIEKEPNICEDSFAYSLSLLSDALYLRERNLSKIFL